MTCALSAMLKASLVCQGLLFWIAAEMTIKSQAFQALLPWLRHHGYDSTATALLFPPRVCSAAKTRDAHVRLHANRWIWRTCRCTQRTHLHVCEHERRGRGGGAKTKRVTRREPEQLTCIPCKGVTEASHCLQK